VGKGMRTRTTKEGGKRERWLEASCSGRGVGRSKRMIWVVRIKVSGIRISEMIRGRRTA